jgi:molecular chaperone DnaK (HSP70)
LKEVYLIPEPSAAILWSMITEEDYRMEENNYQEYQELHHIIDLGAGTMDITSVLKVVRTDFNDRQHVFIHGVNCTGDNFLGGEDIDSLLLEHLIYPKVLDDLACDLMDERNKVPQSILKELVREAKERLSIEENDSVSDYNLAILTRRQQFPLRTCSSLRSAATRQHSPQ